MLAGPIVSLHDRQVGNSEVTVRPFEWKLVGGCRTGFSIANQGEIRVDAVYQKGYPVEDADFCKAYTIADSDPLGEFKLVPSVGKVTVIPKLSPEYTTAPYPCRIRVVMSRGRGVRTITLAPPGPLSEARRAELEMFRDSLKQVCQKYEDSFHTLEKVEWKHLAPSRRDPFSSGRSLRAA